jgi:hypothetical protein
MEKPFFGAVAGALSVLVFTIIHGFMISPIWFMLVPMLVAGAICGLCLSWSYGLLVETPSVSSWLRYNLLYLVLLFGLGPLSLWFYEPMMTIPELLASPNGLPAELRQAVLPLTAVYTLLMALFITWRYGRRWSRLLIVLPTCAILVLLLGLNIAPMGLVYLTTGWVWMLLELLILIVVLNLVFVVVFLLLARDWLRQTAVAPAIENMSL